MGFKTPSIHKKISNFLEKNINNNMVLLAFRGCGKSTIVGLYCSWLLYRNPNLRLLILSAETNLAKMMSSNVKQIIETHPYTKHLIPDKKLNWASTNFTIKRDMAFRECSVTAKGIGANIVGSRADVIICDDVEVPNTASSFLKREMLKNKLEDNDFILTPNGFQLYIGTPHSENSIYNPNPKYDEKEFLINYERMICKVIENGESVWPERFSLEKIERLKEKKGKTSFKSQMMLEFEKDKNKIFDVQKINKIFLDIKQIYKNGIKKKFLFNDKTNQYDIEVNELCFWDPSFGKKDGDCSAVAHVLMDKNSNFYVYDLMEIIITNDTEDNISKQCDYVNDFLIGHNINKIIIETNGIGKFVPSRLRSIIDNNIIVEEYFSKQSKNEKIINALEPLIDTGKLYYNIKIKMQKFIIQIDNFDNNSKSNNDDFLDAVSMCVIFLEKNKEKLNSNINQQCYVDSNFDVF